MYAKLYSKSESKNNQPMGARRIGVVGSYGGFALELALGAARMLALGCRCTKIH